MNEKISEVCSPPNLISLAGLRLVAKGVRTGIDTGGGITQISIGRCADLADGLVARSFGYDHRLNTIADPIADKISTSIIIKALHDKDYISSFTKTSLNTLNASVTLAGTYTFIKNYEPPKVSYYGKASMFLQNLALGLYTASGYVGKHKTINKHTTEKLHNAGNVATIASVGLGIIAIGKYLSKIEKPKRNL